MWTVLVFVAALTAPTVIDGDTLRQGREVYRIENIDAPEKGARAACAREAELGLAATRRARELVAAATRIEVRGAGRRDRYGRLVARISLDGADLGETLIAEGLAQPWRGRKAHWCAVAAQPPRTARSAG